MQNRLMVPLEDTYCICKKKVWCDIIKLKIYMSDVRLTPGHFETGYRTTLCGEGINHIGRKTKTKWLQTSLSRTRVIDIRQRYTWHKIWISSWQWLQYSCCLTKSRRAFFSTHSVVRFRTISPPGGKRQTKGTNWWDADFLKMTNFLFLRAKDFCYF